MNHFFNFTICVFLVFTSCKKEEEEIAETDRTVESVDSTMVLDTSTTTIVNPDTAVVFQGPDFVVNTYQADTLAIGVKDTTHLDINNDGQFDVITVTTRFSTNYFTRIQAVQYPQSTMLGGLLDGTKFTFGETIEFGNVITCSWYGIGGPGTSERYYGFMIEIDGKMYYGWLQLKSNYVVKSSYCNTPDYPITVGQEK